MRWNFVRAVGLRFLFIFPVAIVLGASGITPASAQNFGEVTETLGRLPLISAPRLSPTGRFLAIKQAAGSRYAIVIYDLAQEGEHYVWNVQAQDKLLSYRWVAEDRLLVETMELIGGDRAIGEYRTARIGEHGGMVGTRVHVQAIDYDGRNHFSLYTVNLENPIVTEATRIVDYIWSLPNYILFTPITGGRHPLYRMNIREPDEIILVDAGTETTRAWLTDRDGHVRARIDAEGGALSVYARIRPRSRWRRIARTRPLEESMILPITFSAAGDDIYVRSNHEDRMGLYRLNLFNPDDLERIYLHEEVDIGGAIFRGGTREPLAVVYTLDTTELHFLDEHFERLNQRLANSLPGPNVYIVNTAAWVKVHVVMSTGPSVPPTYYVMDERDGSLRFIEASYPAAEDFEFGRVEPVSYEAADGMRIHGYLTFPPGYESGPLPMVVMPHGGPHARSTMNFNTLAQILATRGYLVFEMNFRGSTGYGLSFLQAGYREWGGLMQSDVTTGIDVMIESGIADPDRICLVGMSYGGYAVMLEAVRQPERFRCVAAIAGVYDLVTMLESPQGIVGSGLWDTSIGTVENDRAHLEAISPIHLLREGLPPIFLGHGQRDYTVPYEQTIDMIEALEAEGYFVSAQIFPQSDHYFEYQPERIEMFGRIVNFLDEHMGGSAGLPTTMDEHTSQ